MADVAERRASGGAGNLRAIVLAAGRGARMRPLSDTTPKPLLAVRGKPLVEWHLEALASAGVRDVVVNTAWREDEIVERLGDGSRFGLSIAYSREGRDHGHALETAGGIAKALPLLGDAFWVVSADIHAPDFAFSADAARAFAASDRLGKLWLVENPPYHPAGDFGLAADGFALADDADPDGRRWTYANFALLRADLFGGIAPGETAKLAPLLCGGMREHRIEAEVWPGTWANVGTPEDLAALNEQSVEIAPAVRR